jgi:ubiquinone/menaquinone biosynthesis C-methylase UbiE
MLDLAGVGVGSRVLDLAAGTGDQSMLAAQRVGPSGWVLASDVSASMLEVAAQVAAEAGFGHVQTRVMDASSVDLEDASFDAVISRLGLMFVPDLTAALRGARRVLVPDGRLAAIVWSAAERNPLMGTPQAIADRLGLEAESRQTVRRALSLGDPHRLRSAMTSAGFDEVVVEATAAPRHFDSASAAVHYERTESPAHRDLSAALTPEQAESFWAEVEAAYRAYEGPDGCVLPGEVLIVAGAAR